MRLDVLAEDHRIDRGVLYRSLSRIAAALRRHESKHGSRELGLLEWGREYLPRHFELPPSLLHRWIARQTKKMDQERGRRVNVIGPRGGAKSTVGTLAFVLRCAVQGTEPYIWIVSHTLHQARLHLDNVKMELLENRLLARDYPHASGKGREWLVQRIVLRNSVAIEAIGTGQSIRGRRHRAHRPTLIVCDDLETDDHAFSATRREMSREWFQGTLLKAGGPRTNVLHLATALHRDALALALHRAPGWHSAKFPAIRKWPRRLDLWQEWEACYRESGATTAREEAAAFFARHRTEMLEGAKALWPEYEDLYKLMCQRAEEGHLSFEREKQANPINPDLCEFPAEYFSEDLWFDAWPGDLQLKTMALDPSKGASGRRGDYSAFVLLGIDAHGLLYVEADQLRQPLAAIVDRGVELFCRFRPDAFAVEANQFQELLNDEFARAFQRSGVLGVRPWAIENHVAKGVRIRRLGPYLASRRLRFKAGSPGTRLLVEQLQDFPLGDHDDGPDALEMALRLAVEYTHDDAWDDGLGNRLL